LDKVRDIVGSCSKLTPSTAFDKTSDQRNWKGQAGKWEGFLLKADSLYTVIAGHIRLRP
jgi:hypothetical protein